MFLTELYEIILNWFRSSLNRVLIKMGKKWIKDSNFNCFVTDKTTYDKRCKFCDDCKMIIRYGHCSVEMCGTEMKSHTCQKENRKALYLITGHINHDENSNFENDNLKKELSAKAKDYLRIWIKENPGRAPRKLLAKLRDIGESGELTQVRNFKAYYSKTKLGFTDKIEDMENMVRANLMLTTNNTEEKAKTKPYFFALDKNEKDEITLGSGSEDGPFILLMTSEALMLNAKKILENNRGVQLHVDSTYKLNIHGNNFYYNTGFPVIVIGISDPSGQFHLVCIEVHSNERTLDFIKILSKVKAEFQNYGVECNPSFVICNVRWV